MSSVLAMGTRNNERMNKRIRWFFPNKTNFEAITKDQVIEALDLINHRPLKVLHWHTAIETFYDNFVKCSD